MLNFLRKVALALIVPIVAFGGPAVASAAAPGGFEMGDFYRGMNDTKATAFMDPVSADPCDTVTLKMRLHNPGPSIVHNVNVQASVPSGKGTSFSSVATVTAADSDPQTVTDSVAINVSKSTTINYVPGSTELLDAHDGVIKTLPDGAIQSGVNIGDVGVSTEQKRFVEFKLKLSCEETPPVTPPNTPQTPVTPQTPSTPSTPASLPATGPEALASGVMGSGALGYGVRRWLVSRRALRDALKR